MGGEEAPARIAFFRTQREAALLEKEDVTYEPGAF